MIIKALMMGSGIGLMLLAGNNGVMLLAAGLLFGMGLHWYRKGFSWKTLVVGMLMAAAVPLGVGAVTMGEWLLALIAFVPAGVALRMVK